MVPRADLLESVRALREQALHLENVAARLRDNARELEEQAAGDLELLRGRAITDEVTELLDAGESLHYLAIHGVLRGAGKVANGVDPQASLLTALSRDERFVAEGRGIYRYEPAGSAV